MKVLYKLTLCAALLLATNSCSDDQKDESEQQCDQYYLDTTNGTQVFYYANNKVSEYVFEEDTIAHFTYNANGKLEWLLTPHGYKEHYVYDENGRLDHKMKFFVNSSPDSLVMEYDENDRISQITYYNFDFIKRTEYYTYTGQNATEVVMHNTGFNPGIFRFEYDTNPVPWPQETLPFIYMFQDGSLGVNNVTKQTIITADDEEYVTKYAYRYNAAGYPVESRIGGQKFVYTYRCTPRLRGVAG